MQKHTKSVLLIGCILLGLAVFYFIVIKNDHEDDLLYYPINLAGTNAIRCGMSLESCDSFNKVLLCAESSYKEKKAFSAYFNIESENVFVLVGNHQNELFYIHPNRNTERKGKLSVFPCKALRSEIHEKKLKFVCDDLPSKQSIKIEACAL